MYVVTTKAASLLEISTRRLRKLLAEGRVIGAYKAGKFWLIPLHNGMPVITKGKRGQKGTWKIGQEPSKVIVHINKNAIGRNIRKKPKEREAVIGIKGAQLGYVHHLEIPAPCRIVYSPDKPLHCGARVWIEVLGITLDLMAN